MKTLLSIFLLATLLYPKPYNAQDEALNQFISACDNYIAFRKNPPKEAHDFQANDKTELEKVNLAFQNYALSQHGVFDTSKGFRENPSNKQNKFKRHGNSLELNAFSFEIDGEKISFIGYYLLRGIVEVKNYLLKNETTNSILYVGNDESCYIDWLEVLDKSHIILCERFGEMGLHNRALVLNTQDKIWKSQTAFKSTSSNEAVRKYLNFFGVFSYETTTPKEGQKLYYDKLNKEVYYFVFNSPKDKKRISAQWQNTYFKIDDYEVKSDSHIPTEIPARD